MIFQYNGYDCSRIYIEAKTWEDAQSKANRRDIFRYLLDQQPWTTDLSDLKDLYNMVFENWYSDTMWEPWGKVSDKVFIDSHY